MFLYKFVYLAFWGVYLPKRNEARHNVKFLKKGQLEEKEFWDRKYNKDKWLE